MLREDDIKIAIICPYFGTLPEVFKLWLKGIEGIDGVRFLLITDQVINHPSKNLTLIKMSFSNCKKLIKSKLNLEHDFSPYKLCDFKPAFGLIFSELIENYNYWGYCDLDLCFGDLDSVLEKKLYKSEYFRLFDLGHLSVFKKTPGVINLFKNKLGSFTPFNIIKNSQTIWVFDENYDDNFGGYNRIFKNEYGSKFYNKRDLIFDVRPSFLGFFDVNDSDFNNSFFYKKKGKLYAVSINNNSLVRKELCYAHFQKREVKFHTTTDGFLITPKHWPSSIEYDDAVILLKSMRSVDLTINKDYERWKIVRRNLKLKRLFFEPFIGRFKWHNSFFIIFNAITRRFR